MKALLKKSEGHDQMEVVNIEQPTVSGDLVKIKVAYTGVCGTDLHIFNGLYPSARTPLILGHEFSGVVTDVGPDVKNIKIGQRVTSETTFATCGECVYCQSKDYNLCSNRRGIGTNYNGSMAEYVLSREESVHILPNNVSLISGALTEPLACGVHASMEKSDAKEGQIICIFGVGAIGLLLAQVAKARGAFVIIAGLDSDQQRFEVAKKMGIDRTVNQMKENINEVINNVTNNVGVDIAYECSGAVPAANKCFEVVRKKGKVVQMGVFHNPKETIATDLILHKEIEYIGSRSQKPSSWVKSIKLLKEGTVIPEMIVTDIVSLDNWRQGFEIPLNGDGIKTVIKCNEDLEI